MIACSLPTNNNPATVNLILPLSDLTKVKVRFYVKHYPDKIVIENPGAFLDGITENNIITHPSVPRNKLIAETLQHLKYVQRTGQGVDIIFREIELP